MLIAVLFMQQAIKRSIISSGYIQMDCWRSSSHLAYSLPPQRVEEVDHQCLAQDGYEVSLRIMEFL